MNQIQATTGRWVQNSEIRRSRKKHSAVSAVRYLGSLLLSAGLLAAGTIDTAPAAFDFTSSDFSGTLQQFNPSLGTLTEVDLVVVNALYTATFHIEDTAESDHVSATGAYNYSAALTLPGVVVPFLFLNGVNTASCSGFGSEFSTCSNDVSADQGPLNFSGLLHPAPNLNAYIGLGAVPFNFHPDLSAIVISDSSGNGNASILNNHIFGSLELEYTFDPAATRTPEPSSMALLASGLLFGGLFKLRKRP